MSSWYSNIKTTFYYYTLFLASSNLWKLQPSVDICEWRSPYLRPVKPSDLSQSISFTQSFLVSISPRGLRLVVGEKVDQGEPDLQTFLQTSKSRDLRGEFSGTGGMLYCLCVLKYVLVWSVEILAPNNLWRATGPASLSHCFKHVASLW